MHNNAIQLTIYLYLHKKRCVIVYFMKPTRLTRKMIERVVELTQLRMSWGNIAKAIGVHRDTLYKWRAEGERIRNDPDTRNTGVHYELVEAIDQAQIELYMSYATVVENEALNGKVTTTEEITYVKGEPVTKTTTKTEPPNAALALKILEREDPSRWADIRRIEIDWRSEIQAQGGNPTDISQELKNYAENNVASVVAIAAAETEDDDNTEEVAD